MARFDVTKTNQAIRRLLETTTNPQHRFLLAAYDRHRNVEMAGRCQDGVRHPAKSLALWAAVLVIACLIAGCGSTVSSAIQHLPSGTVTASPVSPRPLPTSAAAAPPTTAQPSVAPPTTAQPSAAPPTTAQPSRPAVTVTAAVSVAVSATPEAESGTSLLWLWILLGVAVVAGLIAWITHSARRRSAAASSRQSRLIDAYAKGSALHDAMSVAETQGELTGSDAGARWADIQRRADDLTQTLYALREATTDPDEQARISDVMVSLQAVRSAMDAERAPGGAGPQQAEVVRSRLSAFESSLYSLRGSGQES